MSATATAILMQASSVEPLPEEAPADTVALAADAASQAANAPVGGGAGTGPGAVDERTPRIVA